MQSKYLKAIQDYSGTELNDLTPDNNIENFEYPEDESSMQKNLNELKKILQEVYGSNVEISFEQSSFEEFDVQKLNNALSEDDDEDGGDVDTTETSVTEIQLTENATYVRVYDKVNSRMQGGWVMKAEDIVGLTPQEIQNKFALPNTPKYICDVNLEAVTRLRTGEVNPLFGFDGGGQQYDLIINGKNVGTFTNERIIGQ